MFEGKNIHFSPVDNKPLCSFSTKLCKQRRLNGYAFCVRHILEDPQAPFKQCAYVARYNKQKCTNPVPKDQQRQYCNSHMQVLGILPRKERKGKDREISSMVVDSKMSLEDRLKSKFNLRQSSESRHEDSIQDPDDPYAFPDPVSEPVKPVTTPMRASLSPRASQSPRQNQSPAHSSSALHVTELNNVNHVTNKGIGVSTGSKTTSAASKAVGILSGSCKTTTAGSLNMGCKTSTVGSKAPSIANKLTVGNKVVNTGNKIVNMGIGSIGSIGNKSCGIGSKNASAGNKTTSVVSKTIHTGSKATSIGNKTVNAGINKTLNAGSKTVIAGNKAANAVSRTASENTNPGASSIAKLYPELAEKLERVKTKSEPKVKGSSKSSRTMNRLQTKIAQNRIKDKLKKNQELVNQGTPEYTSPAPSAPCTPQTPSLPSVRIEKPPLPTVDNATSMLGSPPMPQFHMLGFPSPTPVPPPFTTAQGNYPNVPPSHLTSLPYPHLQMPPYPGTVAPPVAFPAPVNIQAPCTAPFVSGTPYVPPHMPIIHTRPKRPRNVLSETEARKRLKRRSAVKVYAYYASRKIQNFDLLPMGVDSSDDDSDFDDQLPRQQEWFVASDDEEPICEEDESSYSSRTTQLSLLRARLRRQFMQLRNSQTGNVAFRTYQQKALMALLQAAKRSVSSATDVILEIRGEHRKFASKAGKRRLSSQESCNYKSEEETDCADRVLPYTNHCMKHIMYNADQQLYEFCTAKFSDNTQCCVPVFDLRHELPLCPEHAAKADNYNKNPEPKPKKPRKKTKPSALTRPPKKGKKKKNQKRLRPQKPMPPLEPTGNTEMPVTLNIDMSTNGGTTTPASSDTPAEPPAVTAAEAPVRGIRKGSQTTASSIAALLPTSTDIPPDIAPEEIAKALNKHMDQDLDELTGTLSPGTIDQFVDYQLDTYNDKTRFLDDHDLREVFADEAFDIFTGRNGEFVPTKEETEELERALLEASKDVDNVKASLETLSHTAMSLIDDSSQEDELPKDIAETILNHNLSPGPLTTSIAEDLPHDNLNVLASTLSDNDLKSMSHVLTGQVLDSAFGHDTPHLAAGQQAQAAVQVQGQGQGQGHVSVIQAQLAQGPLAQGPLHIQLPGVSTIGGTAFALSSQGAVTRGVGTVVAAQRPLLLDHAVAPGAVSSAHLASPRQFTPNATLSPHVTTTDHLPSPLQGQSPIQGPSPLQSPLTGSRPAWTTVTPITQTTYHNGFPINASTFAPAIPATGIKFAYPVQQFLPTDLGAQINSALAASGQVRPRTDLNVNVNITTQAFQSQRPLSVTNTVTQQPQPPNS